MSQKHEDEVQKNSSKFYNGSMSENDFFIGNPEEMLQPWMSNPLFFEISIIHAITFIFGLIGNAMVIIVMAGDRRARSATNTFLVSLAVGDLLMLCVYGPLETYHHFVISWGEDGVECKIAYLAEFLSAMSSVLNLLAVTVERFIVIVFPMKSRSLCTVPNMVKAVMFVWLSALALSVPLIFTAGTFQVTFRNNVTALTLTYCDYSLNYQYIALYQLIVVFIIPSTLMTICYSYVIRELWASTRKMNMLTEGNSFSRQSSGRSKSREQEKKQTIAGENQAMVKSHSRSNGPMESLRKLFGRDTSCTAEVLSSCPTSKDEANSARKQVIKMLILVVILFFVCWGPRLIMEVLQKLGEIPPTPVIYKLRMIFNLMTFVHGCVNPFIYCFMSKNFRARFLRFIETCGCRTRRDGRSEILLVPVISPRTSSGGGKRKDELPGYNTRRTGVVSVTACETKHTDLESITVHGAGPNALDNVS